VGHTTNCISWHPEYPLRIYEYFLLVNLGFVLSPLLGSKFALWVLDKQCLKKVSSLDLKGLHRLLFRLAAFGAFHLLHIIIHREFSPCILPPFGTWAAHQNALQTFATKAVTLFGLVRLKVISGKWAESTFFGVSSYFLGQTSC